MDDPELRWLRHNQAALDARLAQVENSLLFRGLRALGTFYQTNFQSNTQSSAKAYRAWRTRHVIERMSFEGEPAFQPLISVSGSGDLSQLKNQSYRNWTPDAYAGEYHAQLDAGVTLAPDTLARAVWAMQGEQPGQIYFDHEITDGSGQPLLPVFKPDWSPVLAETCDYAGPFVLTSREPRNGVIHVPHVAYAARNGPYIKQRDLEESAQPLVSILICTRNAKLLRQCIASLRAHTEYPGYELIVIHHIGSGSDAEIEKIARQESATRIVYREQFNFAAMNNLGARAAAGELLLFLNDDVEAMEPGWLARLVAWTARRNIGAVGAKLVFPNGAIQHAGIATWLRDGAGHPGRNLRRSDFWPWLECSREVTAVTGACLLMRKVDFDAIEGFDPQFPVNFNDVDLCLRLRSRGFSVIVDAETVLRHNESRTRAPGVAFEERRRFYLRWADLLEKVDPFYSPSLAQNQENLSLRD